MCENCRLNEVIEILCGMLETAYDRDCTGIDCPFRNRCNIEGCIATKDNFMKWALKVEDDASEIKEALNELVEVVGIEN